MRIERSGAEEMKHEIIKFPKVLYPVNRSKKAKAIERAVREVISKTPRSFCTCGRNCAVNKKYLAGQTANAAK